MTGKLADASFIGQKLVALFFRSGGKNLLSKTQAENCFEENPSLWVGMTERGA
ncbi:MAG: hypothetical protein V5804_05860 [Mucilaginibacter sp.]|uniref:hypothetical protein n=1 Tax=Mucilaginibacter sp. TaxID=1882438 RepID=UPI0034E38D3F